MGLGRRSVLKAILLIGAACVLTLAGLPDGRVAGGSPSTPAPGAALQQSREAMSRWIDIQQIISKERKDWQQGKEILLGRVELIKKEVSTLDGKIKQATSAVDEANKKRDELLKANDELKNAGTKLTEDLTAMEADIRRLFKTLPDPIQEKPLLQQLYKRMPEDAAKTRVATAERFQNVIGILNELNKANNDVSVNVEVRDLGDGKRSEVQAIYVGLAQGYYISPRGEAGVGRSTPDGWKWEPSKAISREVLNALEIIQGKQSPAFVPLPAKVKGKE